MPSVNPGPSVTQTSQTEAVMAPQNTTQNPVEMGQNQYRLLGVAKGVLLTGTGDLLQIPIINASAYAVAAILVGNAVGGSAAAANLTLNAGAAVSGTQFRAAGVLAGVTGPTAVVAQTVVPATLALIVTNQTIYVNNSVSVAGVTVDIYIYGYDLSVVS